MRTSVQNRAVEPYDYDATLDNDTSPLGMGAVEAGGTPMWHEPGAGAGYILKIYLIYFMDLNIIYFTNS